MKFSEIIDRLNNGETFARVSWQGGRFIVKQIPQTVPADIIPKMTSLPEYAKALVSTMADGTLSYHDQVLMVVASDHCAKSHATYYVPTWEDIFADDWRIH